MLKSIFLVGFPVVVAIRSGYVLIVYGGSRGRGFEDGFEDEYVV